MVDEVWAGCGTTNTNANSCVEIKADVTRYVNKIASDGWAKIKPVSNSEFGFIPKYTKVMLLAHKNGKTFFRVQEGRYKGLICYMSQANATEYLGKIAPKKTPAELVVTYGKYEEGWKSVDGRSWKVQHATAKIDSITVNVLMNSIWREDPGWDNYYPIPPGEYTILLPDTPHRKDMTEWYKQYEPSLQNHQVWFPIKFGNNSRYIHVGNISEGCTTVRDLGKWESVHEALISHRSSDGLSVGKMIVKGKPERTK